jgi:hypothetical protein
VSDITVSAAIEAIYASIKNNNEDLDLHIAALKAAMAAEGAKEAKLMQAYFKKKGIAISFA